MTVRRKLDTFFRPMVGSPTPSGRPWLGIVAVALLLCLVPVRAGAQTVDLSRATLEDLMQIQITSASRKEQRASDAPAAVFVITREDIRRSGMSTLPDVLRLAPGVDVARIGANNWAISTRGFNDLYANKLLVMVDGRTVYNPVFGGVFWDAEDLMLEDIERIEVIRGPGGSVWGANAVNGVVNVITRKAADTQGIALHARTSSADWRDGAVRYGGAGGDASYRVFSRWTSREEFQESGSNNRSNTVTSGFRIDWPTVTVDGSVSDGRRNALWLDMNRLPQLTSYDEASATRSGHVLARWTRPLANHASLQVQSFFDLADRDEPVGNYDRKTIDVDVEYHGRFAGRHDVVAGGGFRSIAETFHGMHGYAFEPDSQNEQIASAFAQDEIGLTDDGRLRATVGAKMERGTVAGANLQPTARLIWTLKPGTGRVWAAVSRAVQTASLLERALDTTFPFSAAGVSLPMFNTLRGNPSASDETLIDVEAGYRVDVRSRVSIDLTGFTGRYRGLRTNEPVSTTVVLAPTPHIENILEFQNFSHAETRGVEAAVKWQVARAWRVDGSYSAFHLTPHAGASLDPSAATYDGHAPATQWQLHSTATLPHGVELDGGFWYVGQLRQLGIPAYTRTDVRVEWPLRHSLSAAIVGQDIFDSGHLEFDGQGDLTLATRSSRSAIAELRWRF